MSFLQPQSGENGQFCGSIGAGQADAGAALLRAVLAQDPKPIRDAELWKTHDMRGFHTWGIPKMVCL